MYELNDLFKRYINNECTQEEIRFLLKSFEISDSESELKQAINEHLKSQRQGDELTDIDERVLHVYKNLENTIKEDKEENRVPVIKWSRILSTAAAVIIICGGLYFFMFSNKSNPHSEFISAQRQETITPGGNKAILTLSDGTQVVLDQAANGLISGTGNAAVKKTADGVIEVGNIESAEKAVEVLTLQTPRGGEYQLTLPDGTKAWLNSASSISFPSSFSANQRKVEISGEVYFEVARQTGAFRDTQSPKFVPFLVKVAPKGDKYGQEIKVLGTHFNVNTYPDEGDYKTTLIEGSVRISSFNASGKEVDSKLLSPGQQSKVSRNIQISNVDVQQEIAWKDGLISFVDADIKSIMRQVSRWYNVDVEYSAQLSRRIFTGKIPRTSNLDQVLEILEKSDIHFKVKDRKITVLP
jgi:transmembrane sensor